MKTIKVFGILALLILIGSIFIPVGFFERDHPQRSRPQFCARALSEQVKEDVSLASVRVVKVYGDRPASAQGACRYDVQIVKQLHGPGGVPDVFSLIQESPKMDIGKCYKFGDAFLVILTARAPEAEHIRCSTSAIYPEGDRERIIKLLTQK